MDDSKVLVERVLAGDHYAFERLIRKYQRLVSHVVFRLVPNISDREDLCQEVFLKVYRSLPGFRFDCKLSTWIARIAYNGCLNFLEKKRIPLYDDLDSQGNLPDDGRDDNANPAQSVEEKDIAGILREEVNRLPVKFRTIVTLYHLEEMSYAEIGQVLDLPEGTIKSHMFPARKLLKERLEARYSKEDLCN